MKVPSGLAVGLIEEERDLQHTIELLRLGVELLELGHAAEELIGRRVVHKAQVLPFRALDIQKVVGSRFRGNDES